MVGCVRVCLFVFVFVNANSPSPYGNQKRLFAFNV